jgi:hypothetical protein
MAGAILKGLHFPTLVSSAELDAAQNKVVKSTQCEVSNVVAKDGGISFQRLDAALPFFPIESKTILKWAPIETDLNEYTLKITGLAGGNYDIKIDGNKIGERTATELSTGVNLSSDVLASGPIADQVKAVWTALVAKNLFFHNEILRRILHSNAPPLWMEIPPEEVEVKKQAAIVKRMTKVAEMEAAIHKLLEMKPHQFEIVPKK